MHACSAFILTMKVNGQWVPCVRNSSYSFIQILLKLYRCLDHPLKILVHIYVIVRLYLCN